MSTTTQATNAPEQAEQAEQAPIIMPNQLKVIREIISLASQRGAFRGEELTTVGTHFDLLDNFIKYFEAAQKAAEEAESDQATAEPEEA